MKGKKPRNPPPKTVSLHCDTSTDDSRPVLYAGANRAGIVTAAGSWPLTLETQRGKRGRSSPFQYRYRGDIKVAKTSADTVSAVTYEYSIVCSEMDELRKWVRATANPDADKAKAAFRKSTLLKGADDIDLGIFIDDFRKPKGSAKAKSHVLTYLARKTGLTVLTIKKYIKDGKRAAK